MNRRCASICCRAFIPTTGSRPKTIGKLLKKHLDEPVRSGGRTLVLRRWLDTHAGAFTYRVTNLQDGGK